MPTHAIQVIDIVKRFGNFTAVDGVSFAVEEGEIFGLLGPNGAGKVDADPDDDHLAGHHFRHGRH